MGLILQPHSNAFAEGAMLIEASAARDGTSLFLEYRITGDLRNVRMPRPGPPSRTDGLWQHTCFEAFIRAGDPYYCEVNLSPSNAYAFYGFHGYRQGMRPLMQVPDPEIRTQADGAFRISGKLDLHGLDGLPPDRTWRIGLSAIIEHLNGAKSYWALAHPPGKPDFHHPDCFALELPAAKRP